MIRQPMTRRVFVVAAAAGIAASGFMRRTAQATSQKLNVKDPAAVALGYVDNSTDADTKRFPSFVKGSNCENCLQLQGKSGDSLRPCSLFADKLVAVAGWCSGWTAEM